MFINNTTRKLRQNHLLLGAILMIVLLGVVYVITSEKTSQIGFVNKCNLPLHSDTKYPYEEYVVESGDTLISISQNKLGDKSRVQELITLNNDNFPTLKSKPEYLEKGWKLLLPPRDIVLTKNDLAKLSGYLHEINEDYLVISTTNNFEQKTNIYITENSKFKIDDKTLQISDLKRGDCVSAVLRNQDSVPNAIIVLEVIN